MTKAQLLFGMAVGTAVAALGITLNAAEITGNALAGTGLLVLLVNSAYWALERRAARPAAPAGATVRDGVA
ncbi:MULTISPECIES: hypothetical protein [Microbulbifer]|uniref:hypothetical protein n=1 Tax=Microbulbifer TaxID=48073 RepID=UPI001E30D95D|nr:MULTISPECIES: hypothetical protein [Microbulbifer]UHQ56234.1 hypothetical protein LVE68_04440 [Microbulbifer sp. YPW16]